MVVNTQPETAVIPSGSPVRPRGILALAQPAPDGWELGGITVQVQCPSPIIRDKCIIIAAPGDVPGRPTSATFPPFLVEQGSGCSTISGGSREDQARDALSQSTDYALGLTLRTGEANGGDAPALNDATSLGQFANAVAAVAALECAAAAAGKGQEYVLHASVGAAAYLVDAGLIDSAGRSPSGAIWIISAGYECDDDTTHRRIWATGRVWAGAGAIEVHESVARRLNNREAWAVRPLIVGFNPCINLTAEFAVTAA